MRFTVGNYRDQHIRHPRPKPGSRQPGRKLSSRRFLPTTRLIAPGSPRMHRRRYIEKSTCRRSRTLRLSLTFKDRTVVSARERQPSACVCYLFRGTQPQFSKNICSEDADFRSRVFRTFVIRFRTC